MIRLSPQDFDAAAGRTQLEDGSKAARGARLVLILGLSVIKAARAVGCTRQAVNEAKRRIIDSLEYCPTCGRARADHSSDTKAGPRARFGR